MEGWLNGAKVHEPRGHTRPQCDIELRADDGGENALSDSELHFNKITSNAARRRNGPRNSTTALPRSGYVVAGNGKFGSRSERVAAEQLASSVALFAGQPGW
mgnify:CR=1 FL=1